MIKTLEDVIDRVRSWPQDRQADAVRVLEAMEQSGTAIYELTDEEAAAVEIGLAQADRGEFVSDADMVAFWTRNRAR